MNKTAALAIELAAAYFGLTPRDVMSRRKSHAATQARFAAWTALNLVHGWTSMEIENEFNHNHTTIRYGWDHSDAAVVESVCEGLRTAREVAAGRIAGTQVAGAAGESGRQGSDLENAPDLALSNDRLRAGERVHRALVPRDSKGGGAEVTCIGDSVCPEGGERGPGEHAGPRHDGSENCFGTLGLLKSCVPSRTRLIEVLRMHGVRV